MQHESDTESYHLLSVKDPRDLHRKSVAITGGMLFSIPPEVDNNYMANLKQKPRVERLRQLGRIMTGRIYQYDENQMSLF